METPSNDRARRAAFMELAGQMYDRMFGSDEALITFTQREDRALELGEKLQTALMEQHLAGDPLAQPAEKSPVCCPDCRQAGRLQKSDKRQLQARTGTVRWSRAIYFCAHCRRTFSPSRQLSGSGPRGL
jgi:hypothetical protein